MKLFLDTANIQEIRDAAALGLLDGVTTNPSLVAKEKRPFKEIVKEICDIVKGDVSAEVTATDTEGMLKEGRELAKISDNVIVKVPLTKAGLVAVQKFSIDEIKCNVTLCFSPAQALMAAKAGAYIISPFVGRLDDISEVGMELIEKIIQIYDNYGYETQVLVASCRHPLHVVDAAMMGAEIATVPYKVFDQMFNHPLTDIGLEKFLSDWKKVSG